MANKIAVVYQHTKINNKWTFRKAPAMRRRFLSDGAYYISWYEGTRKRMERVGPDPTQAEKALLKKSAELSFLAVGGEIKAKPADTHVRVKVSEAVEEYLSDCRDRQGKSGYGLAARTVEAYQYRLGYTHVSWLAKTDRPYADNRQILTKYSDSMESLMARGSYNTGKRPSQHKIGAKSFLTDNGGAIPSNVIAAANTHSSSAYLTYCRENSLQPHPARMPDAFAEYFIKFLTKPNMLVFDPFAGSNTTGAAAERLKRRWLSIEARTDFIESSCGRFDNGVKPIEEEVFKLRFP